MVLLTFFFFVAKAPFVRDDDGKGINLLSPAWDEIRHICLLFEVPPFLLFFPFSFLHDVVPLEAVMVHGGR